MGSVITQKSCRIAEWLSLGVGAGHKGQNHKLTVLPPGASLVEIELEPKARRNNSFIYVIATYPRTSRNGMANVGLTILPNLRLQWDSVREKASGLKRTGQG